MLFPEIRTVAAVKALGMSVEMSLLNPQTTALFQSFMPRLKELPHALGSEVYSLQEYPEGYFNRFDPQQTFKKWALVAITPSTHLPNGMETYEIPGGQYAVFLQKGMDTVIFNEIYSQWLPQSPYELDDRPHFEILGPKYKHNSPDSEEEIWIPIVPKS